jgi:carbamoyltransferase
MKPTFQKSDSLLVIGFNWPNFHDNAVAAILDGKLVYASEEERYTRHKHSPYELPANALEHCFSFLKRTYSIDPGYVDAYAINFDPKAYSIRSRAWHSFSQASLVKDYALRNDMAGFAYSAIMRVLTKSITSKLDFVWSAKLFVKAVLQHMGYVISEEKIKVIPVRHHLAHAASAYYFSGYNSSLALVIDGQGETDSTTAWSVKNGEFENVFRQSWDSLSLGYLYEYVSKYLGFTRLEGPGKLMGLAPYGTKDKKMWDRLESTIVKNGSSFSVSKKMAKALQDPMYDSIAEYVVSSKTPILHDSGKHKLNNTACNYAYTMQSFFEKIVLDFAKCMKNDTGQKDVVLSGGSALNAKANMELYYSSTFNNIFVFPAPTDSGGPIGAAAYAYSRLSSKMKTKTLNDVYLGDSYSDEEIKKQLSKSKLKSEYIGTDVNSISKLISKGAVVGFYNGRSEFGPRALGSRSIVADPRSKDKWERVNSIKGREWWRPLAPSLLEESIGKYFVNPVKHEFMVMMFHTTERAKENAPAINHVDSTARPQSVSRRKNRLWYDLIKSFSEETGESIVINTSFNNAGEPLVETPKQAICSFSVSGLDALYLQGWLIKK